MQSTVFGVESTVLGVESTAAGVESTLSGECVHMYAWASGDYGLSVNKFGEGVSDPCHRSFCFCEVYLQDE